MCFCQKGDSAERHIKEVYKHPSGQVQKARISALRMYCLSNPHKLATVGSILERYIRTDIEKKRYSRVITGCETLDSIVSAVRNEFIIFIVPFTNILNLLFKQKNSPILIVKATETLTNAVPFLKETHKNQFVSFLDPLISFFTYSSGATTPQSQQLEYKVRVAAMRCIVNMIPQLDNQFYDYLNKLIPAILSNFVVPKHHPDLPSMNDSMHALSVSGIILLDNKNVHPVGTSNLDQIVPSTTEENNREINKDEKRKQLEDDEDKRNLEDEDERLTLDPNKSLIEDIQLSQDHVNKYAKDCLSTLTRLISHSTLKNLLKPIFEYLDQKNAWMPRIYPRKIFGIILDYGFANNGYLLVSNITHHIENHGTKLSMDSKLSMLRLINFIIEKQHKKGAVSVRSLEALTGLIRLMFNYSQETEFQRISLQCIYNMAKRGKGQLSLNIDFMSSILSYLKKDRDDEHVVLLFRCLLVISVHSSIVPVGKYYPDHVIKGLLDELNTIKPKARAMILQVIQNIVKGQNYIAEEENQVTVQGGSSSSAAQGNSSSTAKTVATLSKKHREDLHNHLFKCALFKDNKPENFAEILKMFVSLLKQYRNKDLEYTVPMIFGLQEICASNKLSQLVENTSLATSIHTLVLSYIYTLAHIYNNKELEKEVESIISKRLEHKQIAPNCANALKLLFASIETKVEPTELQNELIQFFNCEQLSAVTSENYVNRENVVNILCSIESLKQSYEDVRAKLSTIYSSDITPAPVKTQRSDLPEEHFEWFDEPSETTDVVPEIREEEGLSSEEVKTMNFTKLGSDAFEHRKVSQIVLERILDFVPKPTLHEIETLGEDFFDDEDIDEVSDTELNSSASIEGGTTSLMKQMEKKLYVFDSPEYIDVSV